MQTKGTEKWPHFVYICRTIKTWQFDMPRQKMPYLSFIRVNYFEKKKNQQIKELLWEILKV